MEEKTVIYAPEGMIYTNGKVYGRIIFLANGANKEDYYTITNEEYDSMLAEQAEDITA